MCRVLLAEEDYKKALADFSAAQKVLNESNQYSNIWFRVFAHRLMADPSLPPEIKAIIEQALKAPSPEVAERLLIDSGLLK